jgi:hypothetical protein
MGSEAKPEAACRDRVVVHRQPRRRDRTSARGTDRQRKTRAAMIGAAVVDTARAPPA